MTDRVDCSVCDVEMTAHQLPAVCPHCAGPLTRPTDIELEERRRPANEQGVLI